MSEFKGEKRHIRRTKHGKPVNAASNDTSSFKVATRQLPRSFAIATRVATVPGKRFAENGGEAAALAAACARPAGRRSIAGRLRVLAERTADGRDVVVERTRLMRRRPATGERKTNETSSVALCTILNVSGVSERKSVATLLQIGAR